MGALPSKGAAVLNLPAAFSSRLVGLHAPLLQAPKGKRQTQQAKRANREEASLESEVQEASRLEQVEQLKLSKLS